MIDLDGSGGGGQLVRMALALSAMTQTPFKMIEVRGARPNPGLRPQHLAAVRLIGDICDADVSNAKVGAESFEFDPGECRGGSYEVDIGTAGSITLLFDSVLPLAARLQEPLSATAHGGTDVKWSPTMAYHQHVKLQLLRRFGWFAVVECDRTGFYPAGGGKATLRVVPSSPDPLQVPSKGNLTRVGIESKAASELAFRSVAERQATAAADRLESAGLPVGERSTTVVETDSVGSAITLRFDYEGTIAGFDSLGERGKPAEEVGEEAATEGVAFHETGASVDAHMADQLVIFIALTGGHVRIPEVTDHVETSLELVEQFGYDVSVEQSNDDGLLLIGE